MTSVDIRGVRAGYAGHDVLHGVDLHVPSGAFAAILGESGSGKTTLLRVLAGFVHPTAGTVTFGDRVVAGPGVFVPPEKRRVGIVPQEGALFPHLDVRGNVEFGLSRGERSGDRVEEVLGLVGLSDLGDARPQELSGGQQQRVAVARALAPRPDVMLLDEPFTALDAGLRTRLREDARSLLTTLGITTILVTHDQEEALSTADVVAVMRQGRLIQTGTPMEIYFAPHDLQVARFIGDTIILPVLAESSPDGSRVRSALGDIDVDTTVDGSPNGGDPHGGDPDGGLVAAEDVLVVRPEQLRLLARDDPDAQIVAEVQATRFHGHDAMVIVKTASGTEIPIRVSGTLPPRVGDQVGVAVSGGARRYRAGRASA
jgi:iron(III) transport system ATP-binding protein